MRASEAVARLERDHEALERDCAAKDALIASLKAQAVLLKAQIAALGAEPEGEPGGWADGLTRNQAALMARLIHAKGRPVAVWALAEAMPQREAAKERDMQIVRQQVRLIRAALGVDAIESEYGRGYRVGREFLKRHGLQS